MELLIDRWAGWDVHQATVVATVRVPGEAGQRQIVTETFGTMTPDLFARRDWLQAYGVTHVALESTGIYWKPVWSVLEDAFPLLLINMQDLKRVPGRKPDVRVVAQQFCAAARHPRAAGSDALSGATSP